METSCGDAAAELRRRRGRAAALRSRRARARRYLLNLYGTNDKGRLASFVFVWQFLVAGPLEVASGFVAVATYARYFSNLARPAARAVAAGLCGACVAALAGPTRTVDVVTRWLAAASVLVVAFLVVLGAARGEWANLRLPGDWRGRGSSFAVGAAMPAGRKALPWALGRCARIGVYDMTGRFCRADIRRRVAATPRLRRG